MSYLTTRDRFFAKIHSYSLKLLIDDIKTIFSRNYLQNEDKSFVLVNEVYDFAHNTPVILENIVTMSADILSSLKMYGNGNTAAEFKDFKGNKHIKPQSKSLIPKRQNT